MAQPTPDCSALVPFVPVETSTTLTQEHLQRQLVPPPTASGKYEMKTVQNVIDAIVHGGADVTAAALVPYLQAMGQELFRAIVEHLGPSFNAFLVRQDQIDTQTVATIKGWLETVVNHNNAQVAHQDENARQIHEHIGQSSAMILQTLAYHERGCSTMLTDLQNSVGATKKKLVEMNGENQTNFQQLQEALLRSFQTADRLNLERTAAAEAVIRADGELTRGAQRFEGAATRQQLSATGEGMSAIVEAMANRVASGIASVSTGVNDMRTSVEVTRQTTDATKNDVAACRETATNVLSAIDALSSKVDTNRKAAARETLGSKDALQSKLQDVHDDLDKTTKAVSNVAALVEKAPTVSDIQAVTDYLARLEKIVVERGKAIAAVEQEDHGYAKTGAEILRAAKLATAEIKKLDDNIEIMLTAQTEEIAQRTEEALRARFPPTRPAPSSFTLCIWCSRLALMTLSLRMGRFARGIGSRPASLSTAILTMSCSPVHGTLLIRPPQLSALARSTTGCSSMMNRAMRPTFMVSSPASSTLSPPTTSPARSRAEPRPRRS